MCDIQMGIYGDPVTGRDLVIPSRYPEVLVGSVPKNLKGTPVRFESRGYGRHFWPFSSSLNTAPEIGLFHGHAFLHQLSLETLHPLSLLP